MQESTTSQSLSLSLPFSSIFQVHVEVLFWKGLARRQAVLALTHLISIMQQYCCAGQCLPKEKKTMLRPVMEFLFMWSWQSILTFVKVHNFYQQKRSPWQVQVTSCLFGQTKAGHNKTPYSKSKQQTGGKGGHTGQAACTISLWTPFSSTELPGHIPGCFKKFMEKWNGKISLVSCKNVKSMHICKLTHLY